MSRISIRLYTPKDRAAAEALFQANMPRFFGPEEFGWFGETLDEPDGPLFLVEADGRPAAFGGYELWDHYNLAGLVWGLADPALHGTGLGRFLLFARLARIARETPPTRWVTVDTAPDIAPFFQRCGLELYARWPHGYRAGGERCDLRFDLAATTPDALDAQAEAARIRAEAKLRPPDLAR